MRLVLSMGVNMETVSYFGVDFEVDIDDDYCVGDVFICGYPVTELLRNEVYDAICEKAVETKTEEEYLRRHVHDIETEE